MESLIMNMCQIVPGIVLLLILLAWIFFIRPWEVPTRKTIRVVRSVGVGILTELFVLNGLAFFGLTYENGNCFNSVRGLGLDKLAFFILPLCVGVSIGFYSSYKQLSWLLSVRKKIDRRK
jgi:energy-coupling factor transporter transmembrane protein EcfT